MDGSDANNLGERDKVSCSHKAAVVFVAEAKGTLQRVSALEVGTSNSDRGTLFRILTFYIHTLTQIVSTGALNPNYIDLYTFIVVWVK